MQVFFWQESNSLLDVTNMVLFDLLLQQILAECIRKFSTKEAVAHDNSKLPWKYLQFRLIACIEGKYHR